ncbi:MAG: lysophospholipid acyltransferase family protein, partial [Phormidium sp.]
MNSKITLSPHVSPWLYWSIFPIHRILLSLYFGKIIIKGEEHLPEFGSVVIAPKHYSRWDPLLISLVSREPLFFMTNSNQFGGIQGWLIERLGAFPVDLSHPTVSSMRNAIELLQSGKRLVLFPEGGIVRDRTLRSLKPGLARLVLQAETKLPQFTSIPIVPITLKYQPSANFLADVFINIHPAIYSHDYRQENDKKTAVVLTEVLETALI